MLIEVIAENKAIDDEVNKGEGDDDDTKGVEDMSSIDNDENCTERDGKNVVGGGVPVSFRGAFSR